MVKHDVEAIVRYGNKEYMAWLVVMALVKKSKEAAK